MSVARRLDVERWVRRDHFRLFRDFERPHWNVCAPLEVGRLAERCRRPGGPRFGLALFHLSLAAANQVEELRYRLRDDGVAVHERVGGGTTVLRPDGTFGFAYFDHRERWRDFAPAAAAAIDGVAAGPPGLAQRPGDDLIRYSVLPWIAFTSFAHARDADPADSIPRIVFGRRHGPAGRERVPVSVEVHHALVDGLHVGRFFERFQELVETAELEG